MKPSLAGRLGDFDLLQVTVVLQMGHATGVLSVSRDDSAGRLYVKDGEIIAAETGALRGELAAYELLTWSDGEFEFWRTLVDMPRETQRRTEGLLLEGMRLIDESRDGAWLFTPTGNAESLPAELAGVLAAVGERVSITDLARTLGTTRLTAYHHLEQLERLGVLTRSDAAEGASGDKRLRVLIVDDSALMRKVLRRVYEADPELVVVGEAEDGEVALKLLVELQPDVVSLDLYMPVLDGATTLKRLMQIRPTPTVVMTSASPDALELTFEQILLNGAVDFITKPSRTRSSLELQEDKIRRRVHKAAQANLRGLRLLHKPRDAAPAQATRKRARGALVAVGGTGACLSYMQLLSSLPEDFPYAVVGYVGFPDEFLPAFASQLSRISSFHVEPARDGAPLESGVCYLGTTTSELRVVRESSGAVLRVIEDHPAAISSTLGDVAAVFGPTAVALLLSGEGEDALAGLAAVRAAGGLALAQLPATCVDPEQCERARELAVVDESLLLANVAGYVTRAFGTRRRHKIPEGTEAERWQKASA